MNGQLSENPLAELIREISIKNLSGRLQLCREKVRVAIYFQSGVLTFAACNLPNLRLSAYLLKHKLVTEDDLLYLGKRTKDFDLARTLISENRITLRQTEQLQIKQVSDILRLSLLWTAGTWEFEGRSHLDEKVNFRIDVPALIVDAVRRLPVSFMNSRFRNSLERFAPVADPPNIANLLPIETFLLSRFDGPMSLNDAILVSGIPDSEAQQIIYSLALIGMLKRENWRSVFRDVPTQPRTEPTQPPKAEIPKPVVEEVIDNVESFLDRLATASTHYEVLDVGSAATMAELKNAYYDLARKYHPDRYRTSEVSLFARVDTAFARITQAYDVLRDPGQRATYDSKLEAQERAAKLAQLAPKGATAHAESSEASPGDDGDESMTVAQRAEIQFKEGFAALELGQRNVAIGLLGSAAKSVPNESRYRAYYGRSLAMHESTRRLAEAELQAAIKLEPKNAEYRMMLAELFRDLGFIVRARSEAERAVAADKNNRKARELLKSLTG